MIEKLTKAVSPRNVTHSENSTRFSVLIRIVQYSLYNHIIIESTMSSDISIPVSEITKDQNSSLGPTMSSDKSVPESIPVSEITKDQISNVPDVQYNGILVPHDGSEKSDVALRHAIYLSKLSF